jgi:hypothetical protein
LCLNGRAYTDHALGPGFPAAKKGKGRGGEERGGESVRDNKGIENRNSYLLLMYT